LISRKEKADEINKILEEKEVTGCLPNDSQYDSDIDFEQVKRELNMPS